MRKIALVLIFSSHILFAQNQPKIKVALLGTVHFGDNTDYISSDYNDLLSVKRQKEINEVVNKLAKFNPAKIFVENTSEAQKYWDKVYTNWKVGIGPLDPKIEKNEVFQLGIKLATKINNPYGVICVNYVHPESNAGLINAKNKKDSLYAQYSIYVNTKKPNLKHFFEQNPVPQMALERYLVNNDNWKKLTLKKYLLALNTKESLQTLHYLNVTAYLDQNPNEIGAELTAKEYFRNAQILKNILKNTTINDNKILLIIGAAHVKSLADMVMVHPLLELVDAKQLLK